ncbi:hypothetical protein EG68_11207 [Paragonimus skrjabini miyazakii]|uniref:peptide-methionine (R)-S-oxide reductase n=1 Tax=Paragonimus skrjabini miyazakii TaxID=59628 RepID=A0A8S9YEX0_9TREM|nr:hypothetical protein EG68_11207 [Paragonimus skrjabini miyazakii]
MISEFIVCCVFSALRWLLLFFRNEFAALDQEPSASSQEPIMPNVLSREQLKLKLSALQFKVTQEKFTEKPFSGKYLSESRAGFYVCVVCNSKLFDSASKFNSSSGWPSFSEVIERRAVALRPDTSSEKLFLEFLLSTSLMLKSEVSSNIDVFILRTQPLDTLKFDVFSVSGIIIQDGSVQF